MLHATPGVAESCSYATSPSLGHVLAAAVDSEVRKIRTANEATVGSHPKAHVQAAVTASAGDALTAASRPRPAYLRGSDFSLKSQERTGGPFANSDSWCPTSWVWLSAFKLKKLLRRSANSNGDGRRPPERGYLPVMIQRLHLLRRERWAASPTKTPPVQTHCKFGNEIQTFSADFTTGRVEGTDRNRTMGMYSGDGVDGRWG